MKATITARLPVTDRRNTDLLQRRFNWRGSRPPGVQFGRGARRQRCNAQYFQRDFQLRHVLFERNASRFSPTRTETRDNRSCPGRALPPSTRGSELFTREAEVCNHSHHETKPLRWAGRRYFALWRCICGLGHPIARGTILSDLMGSPLRPEWSRASGIAALPFTLMYIVEGRGSLKGWRATGARTRKERPPVPPHRAASHMTNGPYSYASREAGPRG
ncbi:unnamed protein product [Nesidiocoris tenuis]|uniref:Uncharacterized protein n=1 Tax=Nesidiocoris tenuis TaxID=355587 RepID=A0A6H5HUJ3_9HEMI|nr:unnamed protein product [Nesidiocoris tenuis]